MDTGSNPRHCGGCNRGCASGENCQEGQCRGNGGGGGGPPGGGPGGPGGGNPGGGGGGNVPNCPAGRTNCAGSCVNLRSDADNCGSCNNKCKGKRECLAGTCSKDKGDEGKGNGNGNGGKGKD